MPAAFKRFVGGVSTTPWFEIYIGMLYRDTLLYNNCFRNLPRNEYIYIYALEMDTIQLQTVFLFSVRILPILTLYTAVYC